MEVAGSKPLHGGGVYILLAGQFLPVVDFSIVNVALNAIQQSLQTSETQLVLIVAIYGVVFALGLAMGGRLGDNFGRRRLFQAGVFLFTLASLGCGLTGSISMLLVARAAQAAGAALLVPQILATVHVTLDGQRHSRALGLYVAVNGLSFVVGQVLGGFLVSANVAGLGWRSIFLVNLPIGLAIVAVTRLFVPETRSAKPAKIDWPGTVALAFVLLCLLIPLSLGPVLHWPLPCIMLLVAVLPLSFGLWKLELRQDRRSESPLLPPSLLRLRTVRFGLAFVALYFASYGGYMFITALTLQVGAGFSAAQSGDAFIAVGLSYFFGSLLTSSFFARYSKKIATMIGAAIQMTGLVATAVAFRMMWPSPTISGLVLPTCLIGFGSAFLVGAFFRITLSEIPSEQAGAGSALLSTVQQASFGLGPALFGAVLTQVIRLGGGYLGAEVAALSTQLGMMIVLVGLGLALWWRRSAAELT